MAFKQEPFNEAVVSDILAYFDAPYITYYLDYMSDETENVSVLHLFLITETPWGINAFVDRAFSENANRLSGGLEYVIHRIVSMIVVIMDLLSIHWAPLSLLGMVENVVMILYECACKNVR